MRRKVRRPQTTAWAKSSFKDGKPSCPELSRYHSFGVHADRFAGTRSPRIAYLRAVWRRTKRTDLLNSSAGQKLSGLWVKGSCEKLVVSVWKGTQCRELNEWSQSRAQSRRVRME